MLIFVETQSTFHHFMLLNSSAFEMGHHVFGRQRSLQKPRVKRFLQSFERTLRTSNRTLLVVVLGRIHPELVVVVVDGWASSTSLSRLKLPSSEEEAGLWIPFVLVLVVCFLSRLATEFAVVKPATRSIDII